MSVSAIVPAHDEAPTVGAIVRALKASPEIGEVIVVSDGSSDETAARAREAGADLVLEWAEARGKGGALAAGVAAATGDVLLFCDADLYGFTSAHAVQLLRPVMEGRLAMCIGLTDRGPAMTRLERHLPHISGERALTRAVFEATPAYFRSGYGIEAALNYTCHARKLAHDVMPIWGVTQRRKMQKVGVLRGFIGYVMMISQVVATMLALRLNRKAFLRT